MSKKNEIILPAHFVKDKENKKVIRIQFSDKSRSEVIRTPQDAENEIAMNLETGRLTTDEASVLRSRVHNE